MARAGYCGQCEGNVWITPDGTCVNGHSAQHVSGVYEVPGPPPADPAPKRPRGWVVALIIAAVLLPAMLMVCGIFAAIAIPVFSAAKSNAERKSCYANQRTLEGAAITYWADSGNAPASIEALIGPNGLIDTMPVCPAGGTYTYTPGAAPQGGTPDPRVTCSQHGSFHDPATP